VTALIAFCRALVVELNQRADGWARDASGAPTYEIRDRYHATSSVLREIAGALEVAAKRTLFT